MTYIVFPDGLWGGETRRTPVTPINSVNDVEPGPRNFAHLASSQSVWLLNGANGLGDGPPNIFSDSFVVGMPCE